MTEESLKQMAHDIRCDVLRMYYRAGWGHIASALSCVDLLTAVYFGDDFFHAGKDHVVLSKGHATAAQYAILARLGMIERSELITFYQPHSRLLGLASSLVPGIDVPTGSLGQGLCFATGTSLAAKIDNSGAFTYVVLGDGEMQEGSVWEAAMFAGNQRLGKLIAIADVNGLQASGKVNDIAPLSPLCEKWRAFGWRTVEIDGHNVQAGVRAIQEAREDNGQPTFLLAHTVKGKGLSFVENREDWHSHRPTDEEWKMACDEMGMTLEELKTL